MTLVTNCALSVDRFGAVNSALAMTSGYATLPPGVYFDPDTGGFTIMLWVKMIAFPSSGYTSKIIDFSTGLNIDSIRVTSLPTGRLRLAAYIGNTGNSIDSVGVIQLNQWTHVAASVNGSNGYIYINGILDFQGSGRFFLH